MDAEEGKRMYVNRPSGAAILCIDDDRDTLNLLEKILTGASYTVITAGGGRQGIVEARNNRPDLILLDVIMPEINGFMVCSQLQADPDTAYIPVVFLTSLGGEEDRAKAFAVGAADYLAKPVQKEILLAKVGEQLKTRLRWQELKAEVVFRDEKVKPANFSQFKQSLTERLALSQEIRDRLAGTAPADIYKICDALGIPQGQMTAWMADFLSLPLIEMIDPATLLLGILPLSFARENRVVAMDDEKSGRSFILSNPFDWILLETLKKFFGLQRDTLLQLAEPDHIHLLFEQSEEAPVTMTEVRAERPLEVPAGPVEKMSLEDLEKRPAAAIANNILYFAVSKRASDIHIEPKAGNTVVRFRIDGDMREVYTLRKTTGVMLISRLKAIAGLDITERKKPQDGAVEAVIAGKTFKLRLATTSTPGGESLIMRLLELGVKAKDLQSLGMTDDQVRSMIDFANRHQGLVLIVGPTGSGKTTTIYSLLSQIDCRTRSLISVEDPVEYRIPFANQQQVDEKRGVTFETILKSSVRQDPDILYIGEVRDNYSARVAIDFASTGHLTISTLHTPNATMAIFRLERLGISRGMMADAVLGIVAQRLIKKLCPHCRVVRPISAEEREQLRPFTAEIPSETAYPVGCPQCGQTGYFGREAVYEVMRFDPEVGAMVRSGEPISGIRSFIHQRGDYLISQHAVEKVRTLTTALKDVHEKILLEETDLRRSLPEKGDTVPPPEAEKQPRAILVVEDDEDTQRLITRFLESASYDVTPATDGIDALMRLGQKKFDLILSDITMPNLDGFKLIEMIHQKGIDTPIIFLTGSNVEQSEVQAFELGAVDYIKKPIQKELLLLRVRNALDRKGNRRGI
jgi:type II secretory ATPase GspE/PulE/Tfp pilus assembly ATPase PilB-like protein/DNA-binding response OmpR family regulator